MSEQDAISAFNRMVADGINKMMKAMTYSSDLTAVIVRVTDDGLEIVPLTADDIYER